MAEAEGAAERAERLRREARALLEASWPSGGEAELRARALLPKLRGLRHFDLLARLADRVARLDPRDPKVRRLQTQALIETGHPTAAVEVARAALRGLPDSDPEWCELNGLLGRAYKQILMEADDPGDRHSQDALRAALAAYGKPFRQNRGNVWHACNLIAMLSFARRMKWKVAGQPEPRQLAKKVIAGLVKKVAAAGDRGDKWDFATLAEAHLAIDDLDGVERYLHAYFQDPELEAFDVASTLRQFSEVWGFRTTADGRRQGILQLLNAKLLSLPGARISYSARELAEHLASDPVDKEQLQAILGAEGTRSYEWWKKGLSRAASVGAVYSDSDKRIGTCFLVRGEDLLRAPDPGAYVLTNAHVVSESGRGGDLRPEDATVVFEAVDPDRHYRLQPQIVRFSPVDRHDACLLRLEEEPPGIPPLPFARRLPLVKKPAPEEAEKPETEQAKMRVYVIGYPAGGGLEFSFQDNELLDHESDKTGANPCRVHYRAPTEKGSSGSPVFNRGEWEVIALHHKGGELSRLGGQAGSYLANEGISIFSIAAEFRAT